MAKKRLFIHSTYPAPYRVQIYEELKKYFDCDVFLSVAGGDDRKKEWFINGSYYLMDTKDGREYFNKCVKNLKSYDLALFYEYSDPNAVKLILKCIKKKVPYVINCDGVMLFSHGNFIKEILKKHLVSHACGYLASGEHAKDYLLKYGAKEENIYFHHFTSLQQAQIMKEVVKDKEKLALRKKLNLPLDKKICIAVGRFIPLKRYDILLNLWKDMPKDKHLLLIGGGPEKEKFEKIINDNSLINVTLDDFHPFDELMDYYKACDLFIHPTSYDVWGLILNEAMANGLPIIVTDTCVAGLELIKNGENGYVTHLGNNQEFMRRVNEVLDDDALRAKMAENALETIQPFSVENMIASQLKTIRELLKTDE